MSTVKKQQQPKMSKRKKDIAEKVGDKNLLRTIDDALGLLQKCAEGSKFDQTVEVAIMLGIDAKKSDQAVRGAVTLPKGLGKSVKVWVFAQGDNAKAATEAGADMVGFDDLAKVIKGGDIGADVIVATPDAMRVVGQLGQILGPRGLMPNPKVGTVTTDVAKAVSNAKAGQVRYRIDKAGIIHAGIGKISFDVDALKQNLSSLMEDLKKNKPSASKGVYFKKVVVSTTMGPGLLLDRTTLID